MFCGIFQKVIPHICTGHALHVGGGSWKGDILVADGKELQENLAPEVNATRINAKEVVVVKGDKMNYTMRK